MEDSSESKMTTETQTVGARYQGKRFLACVLGMLLLSVGYHFGDPAAFGAYSSAIVLLVGAYCGGQSWSDVRAITHGKGNGNG